jgi:hypothetical protein
MPAVSRNQRVAAAIAEHEPSKLNPANRGMLSMNHTQLHDFAATPGLRREARPMHPQHAIATSLLKHMIKKPPMKPNDIAEGTNDVGKY